MWLGLVVEGTTQTTREEQRLEAGYTHMHGLIIVDKGEKFSSENGLLFFNASKPNRYPIVKRARAYIPVGKDDRSNVKT